METTTTEQQSPLEEETQEEDKKVAAVTETEGLTVESSGLQDDESSCKNDKDTFNPNDLEVGDHVVRNKFFIQVHGIVVNVNPNDTPSITIVDFGLTEKEKKDKKNKHNNDKDNQNTATENDGDDNNDDEEEQEHVEEDMVDNDDYYNSDPQVQDMIKSLKNYNNANTNKKRRIRILTLTGERDIQQWKKVNYEASKSMIDKCKEWLTKKDERDKIMQLKQEQEQEREDHGNDSKNNFHDCNNATINNDATIQKSSLFSSAATKQTGNSKTTNNLKDDNETKGDDTFLITTIDGLLTDTIENKETTDKGGNANHKPSLFPEIIPEDTLLNTLVTTSSECDATTTTTTTNDDNQSFDVSTKKQSSRSRWSLWGRKKEKQEDEEEIQFDNHNDEISQIIYQQQQQHDAEQVLQEYKENGKTNQNKMPIPKSDPINIVLYRVQYLMHNPNVLPEYNILYSNSECIAVWCKTGRWCTYQASAVLSTTTVGNMKSTFALGSLVGAATVTTTVPAGGVLGWVGFTTTSTVSLVTVAPWLIPVVATYGIVAVTTPLILLYKARKKWEEYTIQLNDGFWLEWADYNVYVEAIQYWSGLQ